MSQNEQFFNVGEKPSSESKIDSAKIAIEELLTNPDFTHAMINAGYRIDVGATNKFLGYELFKKE